MQEKWASFGEAVGETLVLEMDSPELDVTLTTRISLFV